ncbi:MAG: DUF4412 domain-containing protein [Bacteroidetes bacterium]|nr:DUF4412 domain-containing protein [Bacteroidota bacterium]MBK6818373.1 DUF4412 domain-containing protein [Bacteroidota bacterium]MBK7040413.1 DUF4412 domain-containing protein [Bacteroidota bacterium]MBK7587249.1 DUF4412 domain-containing protein [Bacteroidota bacterium]MBK8328227.1 DUF4412 domain-containing protein [Bacteroidota bacterium]
MKQLLLIVFFSILCGNIAMAQRYYIRKAIEKDMEKKHAADKQKGEDAVDERLDTWEANDKASREKISPFPTMSMSMVIEYPEKPKNNVTLDYYFKNYECASVFKMQKENSGIDRMIMNFKAGTSTMLMTDRKGKKTGMTMELKNYDWVAKNAVNKSNKMLEDGDATITPTDEYKTIEGYKCRKYLYEDQNYKSDMWVSNQVGMDYMQFNQAAYSAFANAKNQNNNAYYKAGIHGVVIQHHMYPKGGRSEEAIMTLKNIKSGYAPDEMFSSAGYEVTKMPSMKELWKASQDD